MGNVLTLFWFGIGEICPSAIIALGILEDDERLLNSEKKLVTAN